MFIVPVNILIFAHKSSSIDKNVKIAIPDVVTEIRNTTPPLVRVIFNNYSSFRLSINKKIQLFILV